MKIEYSDQGQLTVKGSSNRMLPRFQEPILDICYVICISGQWTLWTDYGLKYINISDFTLLTEWVKILLVHPKCKIISVVLFPILLSRLLLLLKATKFKLYCYRNKSKIDNTKSYFAILVQKYIFAYFIFYQFIKNVSSSTSHK